MESRPRLTINIEIDEIQSEVLVVSSLNELYMAIDNFFQTYHFSDIVVKQKIKERIITSFRNCQRAQYGVRTSEFNAEAANAFVIKENMKSPAVFPKPQAKYFQTEVKMNTEPVYATTTPKLVDETTKNKSTAKMQPLVRHGSMMKPFPKMNPGIAKKKSVVQAKPSMFASKASTRYTPSSVSKVPKVGAISGKSKHLSQIYPKLQGATTVSTFTDLQHEIEGRELHPKTAINRFTATPKMGMGAVVESALIGTKDSGYGLPMDQRPTEQTFPNDIHGPIYREPAKRNMSALCMTERPAKSQMLTPPIVAVAKNMVYGQTSEALAKSWANLNSKPNVYKDKHHGSSSRIRVDTETGWRRHRAANSDVMNLDNDMALATFEISNNPHPIYRQRTNAESPIKYYDSRVMRPMFEPDEILSDLSHQSPGNTLEKTQGDPDLQYFMKLHYKNVRLRSIFERLDSKSTGVLSETNINLNVVGYDVLQTFGPVITYIFENLKKQSFDFREFLKLVYKFKINF